VATNYDLLKNAGIFDGGDELTPEQQQELENLSADEVQALISIKKKLTKFDWPIRHIVRARMF
jgi:hypothetical protein